MSERRTFSGPLLGVPQRTWMARFGPIWVLTAVLFTLCAIFVPGSVQSGTLTTMLPFAAILATASVGQTFVVQQRGIDLSVPAGMSIGAAVVTRADDSVASVFFYVVLALVAAAMIGLVNGLVISYLSVTPLIATLAVNALALGLVLWLTGGSPKSVPSWMHDLSFNRSAGVPNLVILATLVVIFAALVARSTALGRSLVAIGASPEAARAAGFRVTLLRTGAYSIAGLCYGLAGVMAAGYLSLPAVFVGNDYLLASVAAVVVAGNALTGGVVSFVASAVGALFMSQLNQLVLSLGAPYSAQLLVQAGALVIVVGGQVVFSHGRRLLRARSHRVRGRPALAPSS